MSIKSIYNNLQKIPFGYKAAAGVGITFGVASMVNSFFNNSSNIQKGLPKALNLKGFSPIITRKEAEQILNLPSDFNPQDVQKHHRILMALHHPDKGGSSYIATKINESRDFLALGVKV